MLNRISCKICSHCYEVFICVEYFKYKINILKNLYILNNVISIEYLNSISNILFANLSPNS